MASIRQNLQLDATRIVRMESDHLRVDVAPGVGGRIVSIVNRPAGHEFLWHNHFLPLELKPPGAEYDPNFYGGIDELLPNDLPEMICGVQCPDHGELWTTPLQAQVIDDRLILTGRLALFGLEYFREMRLRSNAPWVDFKYRITNASNQPREFLWKLHAAVAIQEGDFIECPAGKAKVVDPAWSRFKTTDSFDWPKLEAQSVNVVPPKNGTMDFFYLFNLAKGEMFWRRPGARLKFGYQFDTKVFRYAWLFASYGGFLDHYTIILEPCTAMPMSMREAGAKGQCAWLDPGQSLETNVSLYAGPG